MCYTMILGDNDLDEMMIRGAFSNREETKAVTLPKVFFLGGDR